MKLPRLGKIIRGWESRPPILSSFSNCKASTSMVSLVSPCSVSSLHPLSLAVSDTPQLRHPRRFFSMQHNLPNPEILPPAEKVPTGGVGYYRRLGGLGYPMMFVVTHQRPSWQPLWENEHEEIPRDEFGVPSSVPPEVSTQIQHSYYIPPHFFPFLLKLGHDTPALMPYMQKLIKGQFTYADYEEMFYRFAKPLKIYRKLIPLPVRTKEEMKNTPEVDWEGAWLSYRQRVLGNYNSHMYMREYAFGLLIGIYVAYLWADQHRQYRLDMKLFYLESPEHKINWVKPRGDL